MLLAHLGDASRHQLNQDLSGIFIWYFPILIFGLWMAYGYKLKAVRLGSLHLYTFLKCIMIIAIGLFIAALCGVYIGLGLCMTGGCSTITKVMTSLVPGVITLLVTIPYSIRLIRKNAYTPPQRINSNPVLMIIGLLILLISTLVYAPKIFTTITRYVTSQKQL